MQCTLAAHAGRLDEARATGREVIAASIRCGMEGLAIGPMTSVAMVENATGNHQAALDVVAPILFDKPGWPGGTELVVSMYMPEGIEALIQLGRHDDAATLIDQLERNGKRVDRPWTLAMGARYRGMLHAARGDFASALESVQEAMTQHDRMTMPFEKARTQILLGQLQRRQRYRELAAKTLRDAASTFERLGAPLWASRARDELARAKVSTRVSAVLSPSEQRVAELAGKGMTNREVAASLFISPKTVDANMVRIYRKLGIHSRAELGQYVRGAET
jgi:DNA-binding NarL/FixJ family response regulator